MSFSNKHPVDTARLPVPNNLGRRGLSATARPIFLITSINSLAVIWEANPFKAPLGGHSRGRGAIDRPHV